VIIFAKQVKRQVNFRNRVSNEMNFNALQLTDINKKQSSHAFMPNLGRVNLQGF
jgi:hypothetical protein